MSTSLPCNAVAHENALASSGKPYALALHSFQGPQQGDLSFVKGDLIELVGGVSTNTGWLKGKLDSSTGIFPGELLGYCIIMEVHTMHYFAASFVEILRYPDAKEVPPQDTVDSGGFPLPPGSVQPEARPRPIPKPRTRLPSRGHDLVMVKNKAPPSATLSNLTPSRSAPAPPTPYGGTAQSASKHGTLPRHPKAPPSVPPYGTLPKPKPKTLTSSASTSKVDMLKSELAVRQFVSPQATIGKMILYL